MLPARDGDCLLLEYGDGTFTRRILIDGGRSATYPALKAALDAAENHVDVLVVTHVDRDHIMGVLKLLEDDQRTAKIDDVWFNGYHHLLDSGLEQFGPKDGE